jgi:hypothetical protein
MVYFLGHYLSGKDLTDVFPNTQGYDNNLATGSSILRFKNQIIIE